MTVKDKIVEYIKYLKAEIEDLEYYATPYDTAMDIHYREGQLLAYRLVIDESEEIVGI